MPLLIISSNSFHIKLIFNFSSHRSRRSLQSSSGNGAREASGKNSRKNSFSNFQYINEISLLLFNVNNVLIMFTFPLRCLSFLLLSTFVATFDDNLTTESLIAPAPTEKDDESAADTETMTINSTASSAVGEEMANGDGSGEEGERNVVKCGGERDSELKLKSFNGNSAQ